ncbi:MAG: AI-2E family transporter [Candidatus Angelobacter sp.]
MSANRMIPPPEQLAVETTPEHTAELKSQENQSQERKLRADLQNAAAVQLLIGVAVVLTICYFAKLVLVTLLVSILIAFMLEPIVGFLQRFRLPRPAGALVAVLLLIAVCWGASYFFYNRAISFTHELPRYSQKIRGMISPLLQRTRELKKTTEQILPGQAQGAKKAVPVKVESNGDSEFITRNLGTVTEVVLAIGFIPFLVYFMLSWQEHARSKSVQLFRPGLRSTAYVTLGQISNMMRSFIAGNFIIGLFISLISLTIFGVLGLPYFYFLGFISGFLSLVPYLGVILAAVPPLAAGLGILKGGGLLAIVATVLGLHLFSMNVLYPKVIGKRVQLNPLLVTISLLIWGWIWGALGLILAVPIMAAIKIICDHVTSLHALGEWMGE